jgi:hypothetical protein
MDARASVPSSRPLGPDRIRTALVLPTLPLRRRLLCGVAKVSDDTAVKRCQIVSLLAVWLASVAAGPGRAGLVRRPMLAG